MPRELPILMNTDMVRAILSGRKTQTRRLLKPQPKCHHWEYFKSYKLEVKKLKFGDYRFRHSINERNGEVRVDEWDDQPFSSQYQVGDILYVRETFRECADEELGTCIEYKADGSRIKPNFPTQNDGWKCEQNSIAIDCYKFRPSIHMPKWAARIFLEVIDIRIQRIQEMSAQDFIAEGCGKYDDMAGSMKSPDGRFINHKKGFIDTWNSIYKKQGFGWDENPWVFVYEFEKMEK